MAGALLGLGAALSASTLDAPVLDAPATVTAGQIFQVTLRVGNSGPATLQNVRASLGSTPFDGFVPVYGSGPIPVSHAALTQGETAHFTWTYSGAGCGSVQFGATVSADEAGTPVPTVVVTAGPVTALNCTPTVTPTPWIVYGTPTAVPREGWAGIPGNLYRPLLGQPLQLQAVLPEAARLSVDLYDRLGNRVKRLETDAGPGGVSLAWDGRSDEGVYVATGIYVAHFKARGFSRTVKFAVLK